MDRLFSPLICGIIPGMLRCTRVGLCFTLLFFGLFIPLRSVLAQNFSAYDLIAAVNSLRASRGLAPYAIDGALMAYAQEHSEYQASTGISTHTHSDGLSPRAYGVTENIASGSTQFMTLEVVIYQIWADAIHMNTMVGYESGFAGAGIAVSGGSVYITLDVRPGQSAATLDPSGSSGSSGASLPAGTQIALVPLITATPGVNGAVVHPVGYGQSLWSIAIAYGVKIDEIRSLNGLAPGSTDIYAGQKLVIHQAGTLQQTIPAEATSDSTRTAAPIRTPTLKSSISTPTASATPLTSTPTAAPLLQDEPRFSLSLLVNRRLLASLLIIIGAAGVVWVIRSGFLDKKSS